MVTAMVAALLIIGAGLVAVFWLYRGARWRLIALWPAGATAVAVAVTLGEVDTTTPWWIFALGSGVVVYVLMLLAWLGAGENLSRLFRTRF